MNKFKNISTVIFYTILLFIFLDMVIFRHCFHLGVTIKDSYGSDKSIRKYQPYFEFMDANKLQNESSYDNTNFYKDDGSLRVAFFGGSTGVPLDERYFSENLTKHLGKKVQVVNFSCSSGEHREHLHMLIELLPKYNPDIIIFYGGVNETTLHYSMDPRPGFPYNYYYKHDTSPLLQFLIENSAVISTLEMKYRLFTNQKKLAKEYNVGSDEYNKKIADKYFETLMLSKNVSSTLKSKEFGKPKFLAFYQPFQIPEYFEETNSKIKKEIKKIDYIFDIQDAYDSFDKNIWVDYCHVKDKSGANKHIIDVMSEITAKQVKK